MTLFVREFFTLFTSQHLINESLGFSLFDVFCFSCCGLHSSQWSFHANISSCKYILFVLERKTPGTCDQMFLGSKNRFLYWDLNLRKVISWKHIMQLICRCLSQYSKVGENLFSFFLSFFLYNHCSFPQADQTRRHNLLILKVVDFARRHFSICPPWSVFLNHCKNKYKLCLSSELSFWGVCLSPGADLKTEWKQNTNKLFLHNQHIQKQITVCTNEMGWKLICESTQIFVLLRFCMCVCGCSQHWLMRKAEI